METSGIRPESPLIIIVGPTASGKTAVAIELAKKLGGEIICGDSRTIYKEMDIGTAKPSVKERDGIPHWGLDLVFPNERFTAIDFKLYTDQKIKEIKGRGNVPILVGGTGLYIDSVIFGFDFTARRDEGTDWRVNLRKSSIVVGIATEKEILRSRITSRAEQLFSNGVVEEATILGKKYGWDMPAMTGNIYPIARAYLENKIDFKTAVAKFTTEDWRLAKRQMTWFRPNPYIEWCQLTEVEEYINSRFVSE